MRQWKIFDNQKDPNAIFNKMVEYFTIQRIEHKRLFKETGDKYYDDLQGAEKIAINSLYGLNGTSGLNFNNFKNADMITTLGRLILRSTSVWATGQDVDYWFPEYKHIGHDDQYFDMLNLPHFEANSFVMVNGDTDSLTFKKLDESEFTPEEIKSVINEINSIMPELVNFEDDGYFPKVLVLKAKNYVLFDGKKIKFKGSSLRNSRQEPALKEMMDRILKESLIYETADYVDIYEEYIQEIRDIKDIKRWAKKESVTETLFESDRLTETKKVDAIGDMDIKVGDKVYLYNAIDGMIQDTEKDGTLRVYKKTGLPKMLPNRILKHIDNFNNDYELEHYLKKCYDSISILSGVIDMERIKKYKE
jgi:DNA polymerase elongation subunit (family B)